MKRTQTAWLLVVLVFAALTGCAAHRGQCVNGGPDGNCAAMSENGAPCETCRNGGRGEGCDSSDGYFHPGSSACPPCGCHGGCAGGRGAGVGEEEAAGGPPSGATAYPYYTVRGPRDFLAKNPPSIGP